MVIKRPVYPENDYLSLKLCIVTSIYRTFSSNICLKLALLHVQNALSFFKNNSLNLFYCSEKFTPVKKYVKNALKVILWC